ncbi:MAG: D-alanine--D-alanine ligase family protein [Acidobacteriota bacterium]|nr:D-alanine--D-alanine ligase family protein [Acidobacteriota bacterium]
MASEISRVGLVFGGRSAEHRVSVDSAHTVAAALAEAGFEVVPLGIDPDGRWLPPEVSAPALAGDIDELPAATGSILSSIRHLVESGAQVLFPIVHGSWGEDGALQGLAEMLDLPYVGADVPASAVSMDKVLCKNVLEHAGVPVVEYRAFSRHQFEGDSAAWVAQLADVPLPLFVKPATGGSSVGVRKVAERSQVADALAFAFRFSDRVLVERGVQGRELECAVLGHRQLRASVIGEIVAGGDFYDYADKYLDGKAQLLAPADLPSGLQEELQALAIEAYAAVGGSGLARVDFLVEEAPDGTHRCYVNEINTLPGFTAISMYPRLWELSGIPRPDLVRHLVHHAQERHDDRRRLDQGIHEFLGELEARASKD